MLGFSRTRLFAAAALFLMTLPLGSAQPGKRPCNLSGLVWPAGRDFTVVSDHVSARGSWVAEQGTQRYSPAINQVQIECTPAHCLVAVASVMSERDGSSMRGMLTNGVHEYRVTKWTRDRIVAFDGERRATLTIHPIAQTAGDVVTDGHFILQ